MSKGSGWMAPASALVPWVSTSMRDYGRVTGPSMQPATSIPEVVQPADPRPRASFGVVRLWRLGALKRLLPLFVIVGLIAAFFGFGLNHHLTLQALRDNGDALGAFVSWHPLLAPAAFVAVYAVVVALSVPGGAVMTVAGGLLFGLWMGAALAIGGGHGGCRNPLLDCAFRNRRCSASPCPPLLK